MIITIVKQYMDLFEKLKSLGFILEINKIIKIKLKIDFDININLKFGIENILLADIVKQS